MERKKMIQLKKERNGKKFYILLQFITRIFAEYNNLIILYYFEEITDPENSENDSSSQVEEEEDYVPQKKIRKMRIKKPRSSK